MVLTPTLSTESHFIGYRQGGLMGKPPLEIARLLVTSGADANVTDGEGWFSRHAASQSGHREIAELLLVSVASLDVRNKKQQTPLNTLLF
jgi:ankyrin repeat protein